jgi:hypothetical protein
MFITLGNIAESERVGLLFIDFERPHRLRVHGAARLTKDEELLSFYPGADCLVHVTVAQIFINCGRYIHQDQSRLSPHVPDQEGRQPFPAWKRLDIFDGALPTADAKHVDEVGGTISLEEYRGEADPDPAPPPHKSA